MTPDERDAKIRKRLGLGLLDPVDHETYAYLCELIDEAEDARVKAVYVAERKHQQARNLVEDMRRSKDAWKTKAKAAHAGEARLVAGIDALKAQLAEANAKVAALVKSVESCHDCGEDGGGNHCKECAFSNLPSAARALLERLEKAEAGVNLCW